MGWDTLFYIIAAASAANSLLNPAAYDSMTETPSQPAGGRNEAAKPIMGDAFMDQLNQLANPPIPTMDQIVQNATASAAATNKAGQVKETKPNLEAAGADKKPETPKTPDKPETEIGDILAAIPSALQAVDSLFNQPPIQKTSRPAPAAGGQPGGVVGMFGQGMGGQPNIGQLLASLRM